MLDSQRTVWRDEEPTSQGFYANALLNATPSQFEMISQSLEEVMAAPRGDFMIVGTHITPVLNIPDTQFLQAEPTGAPLEFESWERARAEAQEDFVFEAFSHAANLARILPVDPEADARIEHWLSRKERSRAKTRLPR